MLLHALELNKVKLIADRGERLEVSIHEQDVRALDVTLVPIKLST
mgnify:CR=1 FL=1